MKKILVSLIAILASVFTTNAQTLATTTDGGNPLSFSVDGKTLTAKLKGNATTGYAWTCQINDESIISKTTDQYATNENNGQVGVGGIHTFVFEGAKKGSTKITFTYKRPWEIDGAGVRMLKVKYTGSKIKASEVKK
jgi:predicted secreted protein